MKRTSVDQRGISRVCRTNAVTNERAPVGFNANDVSGPVYGYVGVGRRAIERMLLDTVGKPFDAGRFGIVQAKRVRERLLDGTEPVVFSANGSAMTSVSPLLPAGTGDAIDIKEQNIAWSSENVGFRLVPCVHVPNPAIVKDLETIRVTRASVRRSV